MTVPQGGTTTTNDGGDNDSVATPIPTQAAATSSSSSVIPTTPGQHKTDAPLTVLFLSSDTGGGHRASAMSLARQFELLHPGTTYQLLDVVTECMPVTPTVPYPSLFLSSSQTSMTSLLDGDDANAASDTAATAEAAVEADTDATAAADTDAAVEAAADDENTADSEEVDDNSDDDNSNKDSGSENDNNIDSAHDDDDDEPKESESGPATTNSKNKVVGRAKSCLDELSFATEDIDENGGSPLRLLPPRPSPTTGGRPPAFKKSASAPPAFGIESFYKHLSAHPQQWRLLYHTSNSPPVRLLTAVGLKLATERTVTARIRQIDPDVVVSVHPLMTAIPALACAKLSAASGRHLPFFTVVTDLGSGHDAWFAGAKREVEKIFLASDSITELAVRRGRIPRDKIVRSGLPIRHDFAVHADAMGGARYPSERAGAYRMSVREDKLGLCSDPEHRVVLVMGGGEGNGALSSIVDSLYVELCSRSVDATVVVVCGRNEVLKGSLETRDWDGLRRRGRKRAERRRKTVRLAHRVRQMLSSISTGDLRAATTGTAAADDAVVRFEEDTTTVGGGDDDKSADEEGAGDAHHGNESPESTVDATEQKDDSPIEDTPIDNGDEPDSNLVPQGCGATCAASLCLDARDEQESDGDDDMYYAHTPQGAGCLSPVSSMDSLAKAGSASVQVKPLGFVTNMAEYMVGADLLISKAGPGTIAEAAALGLPVLLTSYLPGQEEGNIDFVLKNEFGAYVSDSDPDGVARQCSTWLRDEEKLAEMSKKATEAGVPNAAEDIARYIGQSVIRWKVHNEAT